MTNGSLCPCVPAGVDPVGLQAWVRRALLGWEGQRAGSHPGPARNPQVPTRGCVMAWTTARGGGRQGSWGSHRPPSTPSFKGNPLSCLPEGTITSTFPRAPCWATRTPCPAAALCPGPWRQPSSPPSLVQGQVGEQGRDSQLRGRRRLLGALSGLQHWEGPAALLWPCGQDARTW